MKAILTTLFVCLLCACEESEPDPYTSDAQYICDTLVMCFGIDVGTTCAQDIESTTAPADVGACAGCYEYATCDAIGEPGTAGVCDGACNAALFGGAQ